MTRPTLKIIDDAVSLEELERWRVALFGVDGLQDQNIAVMYVGGELYERIFAEGVNLPLIHCLLFAIHDNHDTELHRDGGEYLAVFYPDDCPSGPLRIVIDGVVQDIDVRENRLVLLACSDITHQQIVPPDGSVRRSVAFKFRE